MRRINLISAISALAVVLFFVMIHLVTRQDEGGLNMIRVGFVYDGDESTPYTDNFIRAQHEVVNRFGDRVILSVKYNVREDNIDEVLRDLVEEKCNLIFTTSYSYGESAKRFAMENPDIQFCEATCDNANTDPVLPNYHTFMGEIYQGRYISGVVAGMKLREMIDTGVINSSEAMVGYVGAYPYAEVISGYTAFLLGVRSVAPEAVMKVIYTNTWSSYGLEKKCAERLIDEGCVIISQHSDTIGPAVACEEAAAKKTVYHVGYNQSMTDVAPTTSLISCRINWIPYFTGAVSAVLSEQPIEEMIDGNRHGMDVGAGLEKDWVQMLELNSYIAADGTKEEIERLTNEFSGGGVDVFVGDYTGKNPFDETDTIDLSSGYTENENSSAPAFNYVLDDVITIEE